MDLVSSSGFEALYDRQRTQRRGTHLSWILAAAFAFGACVRGSGAAIAWLRRHLTSFVALSSIAPEVHDQRRARRFCLLSFKCTHIRSFSPFIMPPCHDVRFFFPVASGNFEVFFISATAFCVPCFMDRLCSDYPRSIRRMRLRSRFSSVQRQAFWIYSAGGSEGDPHKAPSIEVRSRISEI
ncbi:hypothetical protein MPTK1_4g07720 [Marchantia polymorpha subsp. ruderalis]|uniref:Uncharacterized protein n=2 Tax=Marchantia polymorpha TaxID=3197 RepID=A0AAF6B7I8_MARPO|nr:hypothetical protein MARPO_0115s0008 [Marchantia polymorpha]BBN07972.1 hypothetical protein Mp_4g07720 [Marchantia polymorpha subsp. ruderalis]|eukprot:PTQ31081.1 hypothetical protein MARPO_0115s0008 [Marchantia polymorpha]